MTANTNMDSAIEAFEESIKCGTSDVDSICATYCRLTAGLLPELEICLPETVPKLKQYTPDINVYDKL